MSGLSSLVYLPSTSAGSCENVDTPIPNPRACFTQSFPCRYLWREGGGSVLGLKDVGMLLVVFIPILQTSINSTVLPPPSASVGWVSLHSPLSRFWLPWQPSKEKACIWNKLVWVLVLIQSPIRCVPKFRGWKHWGWHLPWCKEVTNSHPRGRARGQRCKAPAHKVSGLKT